MATEAHRHVINTILRNIADKSKQNIDTFAASVNDMRKLKLFAALLLLSASLYAADKKTPVPEPVDMGLSVRWASANLGASAPEEFGDYYSWGDVKMRKSYLENGYVYQKDGHVKEIGECISGTRYDVARKRLGGNWRMPTIDEMKELVENCSWLWVERNGVKGCQVTAKNGAVIFLPAAGYRWDGGTWYQNVDGIYWTGSVYGQGTESVYGLGFNASYDWYNGYERWIGRSIRPVSD